jgi:hypothetical protein
LLNAGALASFMSGLHPAWCDGILAGNQTKNAKFHDVLLIAWRNGA